MSLSCVWLDVKRRRDEWASQVCAQSYLHNLDISSTTDGAIKWEAQVPWEYAAFNVDWAKQVALMERWIAG